MTVEWSEEAASQLRAIRDYLARTSPGYAQVLAERIIQKTEALGEFPRLGAEVPEYADERVREVFEHPYRIIYLVEGERAQVLGVIHAARRLPRNPPASHSG
ncbi:MAG: type II toxin-antitoxin system RelE/ParE family toxin [Gemmataceae bacterium]